MLVTVVLWLNNSYQATLSTPLKRGLEYQISPTEAQIKENRAIVSDISKNLELPGQEPVFATVTNLNLLKNQDFFAHAQLGDRVLIFQDVERGLLYRPSTHRVIEYGRVSFGDVPY